MDEDAVVHAEGCHFRKNIGISTAGSISARGHSSLSLNGSIFDGGKEDLLE